MKKFKFPPLASLFDAVFQGTDDPQTPWLIWAWLAGLYLLGVFMWGKFLSWGSAPLDFFDWTLINLPRLDFVQDALRSGQLPLHMADSASLHYISDRFFTLPDVITTPQMLLLLFLPLNTFIFLDLLFHYSLGFLGLLWFRRKFKLSLLTFSILFLLFSFNGYILAHYGVGHLTWSAYFLFPLFFALLIRFLEGEQGWRWVFQMAGLLFYMVLAGSQHHFVWLILYLGVLALVVWRRAKWIVAAILSAGLLSAVRLLPPVLQLADYHKKAIFNAVYGFPSLTHVLASLAWIQLPTQSPFEYFSLNLYAENYWDFNFYVGLLGTGFLLFFGLYLWLKERPPRYQELLLPTLAVLALAIDSTYWFIRLTNIPLFASERGTMRMAGLPFVWLLLVAALVFQQWWNARAMGNAQKWTALVALGFIWIDLWSNLKIWRPAEIKPFFGPGELNLAGNSVANHPDPIYTTTLLLGLGLTLLTAAVLFALSWREQKRNA